MQVVAIAKPCNGIKRMKQKNQKEYKKHKRKLKKLIAELRVVGVSWGNRQIQDGARVWRWSIVQRWKILQAYNKKFWNKIWRLRAVDWKVEKKLLVVYLFGCYFVYFSSLWNISTWLNYTKKYQTSPFLRIRPFLSLLRGQNFVEWNNSVKRLKHCWRAKIR